MKVIPPLDSFSPRLKMLQAKKAELHVEITNLKAECAVIRARLQKGTADPGNSQEYRARQLLGETL